jgi:hypothetical protein
MRHFGILAAFAPIVLSAAVGCGGGSPNPLDPQAVDLSGSYVVTTGAVTQTRTGNGGPNPPSGITSPSTSKRFRLDLRRTNGGYEAVLTPEWGVPTPMTVSGAKGQLILTGEANLSGSGGSANVSDRWQTITIPVTSDGLANGISFVGDEMVFEGDVGWNYDVSTTANVAADTIPPELRVVGRGTADGKYLPWDKLAVQASEPIEGVSFQGAVSATVGTKSAVFAPDAPAAGAEWAGSVGVTGQWDAFDVPGGTGTWGFLPVKDRAGNSRTATDLKAQIFEVVELGTPQIAIDFDGKSNYGPAVWGKASVVQGADCEGGGGCASLGVFMQSFCSSSTGGLAARLSVAGGKTLAFRYRVHLEPTYGGSGSGFENATPATLEMARPGAPLATTPLPMPKLTQSGTTQKPIFDSGWVDGAVPLPSGGDTVAFALRSKSLWPYGCGGGPAPAPVDVTVWVDAIRVQ